MFFGARNCANLCDGSEMAARCQRCPHRRHDLNEVRRFFSGGPCPLVGQGYLTVDNFLCRLCHRTAPTRPLQGEILLVMLYSARDLIRAAQPSSEISYLEGNRRSESSPRTANSTPGQLPVWGNRWDVFHAGLLSSPH